MIATIHQPEFLPWLGFFDRVQKADVFIILDDVGYEKNGFINRNKIKANNNEGYKYITVPVVGRSPHKKNNEVLIENGSNWQESHLAALKNSYAKAPHFNEYYPFFEETFKKPWDKIADLDVYLLKNVIEFLGIKAQIEISSAMNIRELRTERLVSICKKVKADTYLSGPGGKDYMDLELFKKENINVVFQEFTHPVYSQQFMEKGFLPGMSIIDLLFNEGPNSLGIIKSGSKNI